LTFRDFYGGDDIEAVHLSLCMPQGDAVPEGFEAALA
jgi:hypothetical protein